VGGNTNMKSWKEYYNQLQKEIAMRPNTDILVEYGEIIYQSPVVQNTRWLVMSFKSEYNVFVDHLNFTGKLDRSLGASFRWKDTAMEFALEMFLVCSGRLRRKDRHSFSTIIEGVTYE
jgi:hypothetical protein